ncbi:hypothetical protein BPO_0705 [Bergeyella porcorum]|uniref:Uncharacterized protein n=1 Tax=Bergeyella porcorum TaxID=1735111 RepID=A0AAU0F219_9FLAO
MKPTLVSNKSKLGFTKNEASSYSKGSFVLLKRKLGFLQ